jgi:hypothetical protein
VQHKSLSVNSKEAPSGGRNTCGGLAVRSPLDPQRGISSALLDGAMGSVLTYPNVWAMTVCLGIKCNYRAGGSARTLDFRGARTSDNCISPVRCGRKLNSTYAKDIIRVMVCMAVRLSSV